MAAATTTAATATAATAAAPPDASAPFHVDGSLLEGGGQILRNAFACSCLLRKPVTISKIRAGRPTPGLGAQHTEGLQLVARMCGGQLAGAVRGSSTVQFTPGPLRGGDFVADAGTAGSVALLLQVSLPCMVFAPAPVALRLQGGTNADYAPQVDYVQHVLLPALAPMGLQAELEVERRGYYPQGGGVAHVRVRPLPAGACLQPLQRVERGTVTRVQAWLVSTKCEPAAAAEGLQLLRAMLTSCAPLGLAGASAAIHHLPDSKAKGKGLGVLVVVETSTGCVLGADTLANMKKEGRRDDGQIVKGLVRDAVEQMRRLLEESSTCVDKHLEDQLILFMALAKGHSEVRTAAPLTLHTQTAIHVVQMLTGITFTTTPQPDGTLIVACEGLGLQSPVAEA